MTVRSLSRRPRRRQDEDARILPLINVVFLLLIFFMVVGHLAATDPFHVEPPLSASPDEPGAAGHVVLVGADGRVAFDGRVMDDAALKAALAGPVGAGAVDIRLKTDGGTSAVRVVEVMEVMRAAGVTKLRILTIPRQN